MIRTIKSSSIMATFVIALVATGVALLWHATSLASSSKRDGTSIKLPILSLYLGYGDRCARSDNSTGRIYSENNPELLLSFSSDSSPNDLSLYQRYFAASANGQHQLLASFISGYQKVRFRSVDICIIPTRSLCPRLSNLFLSLYRYLLDHDLRMPTFHNVRQFQAALSTYVPAKAEMTDGVSGEAFRPNRKLSGVVLGNRSSYSETVFLFGQLNRHTGLRLVAYGDGSVSEISERQWAALISSRRIIE